MTDHQPPRSKRLRQIGVALAILGGLTATAGPAHASDKADDFEYTFHSVITDVDNPCTPGVDFITLDTSGRLLGRTWTNDDGSMRSLVRVDVHSSGAAADGTHYVGADQFRAQTRIEDGIVSTTADTDQRLTSSGDDPNFYIRYKVAITFDQAGTFSTFELLKDSVECRG